MMIDYEKLKEADSICKSTGYSFSYFFGGKNVTKHFDGDYIKDNCLLYDIESGPIIGEFENIDDLISKLKELTQPEPKYAVDDTVWRIGFYQEPTSFIVHTIKEDTITGTYAYFDKHDSGWLEEQLYPSREALIESQIKYWSNLMRPTQVSDARRNLDRFGIESCTENQEKYMTDIEIAKNNIKEIIDIQCSEGNHYLVQPAMTKCKKCGEFYK